MGSYSELEGASLYREKLMYLFDCLPSRTILADACVVKEIVQVQRSGGRACLCFFVLERWCWQAKTVQQGERLPVRECWLRLAGGAAVSRLEVIGEKVGLARCSSKQVSEGAGEVARHAAVKVNLGGRKAKLSSSCLYLAWSLLLFRKQQSTFDGRLNMRSREVVSKVSKTSARAI